MFEVLDDYLVQIEGAGTLAQIGFGLVVSIVFTLIFRAIIRGPVLKKSESSVQTFDCISNFIT